MATYNPYELLDWEKKYFGFCLDAYTNAVKIFNDVCKSNTGLACDAITAAVLTKMTYGSVSPLVPVAVGVCPNPENYTYKHWAVGIMFGGKPQVVLDGITQTAAWGQKNVQQDPHSWHRWQALEWKNRCVPHYSAFATLADPAKVPRCGYILRDVFLRPNAGVDTSGTLKRDLTPQELKRKKEALQTQGNKSNNRSAFNALEWVATPRQKVDRQASLDWRPVPAR